MTAAAAPRPSPWRLVLVLAGLAAAIGGLTLAGRGPLGVPSVLVPADWPGWAAQRDAVTMAFALLRLVTLGAAWYLVGVTVVGALARLAHWHGAIGVLDAVTVPAVRRLLQSALGVGLATAALTVGSPSPDHRAVAPTVATMTLVGQQTTARVVMAPVSGGSETMVPVPDAVAGDPAQAPRAWRVEPGQHFWSIAADVLAEAWGRSPRDDEVTGYWHRLVDANRQRLRDPGNPDLLFPGQELALPPPPPPPPVRP